MKTVKPAVFVHQLQVQILKEETPAVDMATPYVVMATPSSCHGHISTLSWQHYSTLDCCLVRKNTCNITYITMHTNHHFASDNRNNFTQSTKRKCAVISTSEHDQLFANVSPVVLAANKPK